MNKQRLVERLQSKLFFLLQTAWTVGMLFSTIQWLRGEFVQESVGPFIALGLLLQNIWLILQLHVREKKIGILRQKSERDALTGLKNRMAFAAVANMVEEGGKEATILVCDIDGLKWINDTMGHHIGDEVIRKVAGALIACCPNGAQIFRMGGDEFVALISDELSQTEMGELSECLHKYTQTKEHLQLSIGLASLQKDMSLKEAIRIADCEMYRLRKKKYQKCSEVRGCEQKEDSKQRNQVHNVEFDIV